MGFPVSTPITGKILAMDEVVVVFHTILEPA